MTNKLILTILDGWGEDFTHTDTNAIEVGKTPVWHRILQENINNTLITYGEDVGLPEGQMGNSEVGHTNIGAGRIVFQEFPKINRSIANGEFAQQPQFAETIKILKENNQAMHIMGLFSPGGVHSHMDHFLKAAEIFASASIQTYLHLFTDGRDTPPQSADKYFKKLDDLVNKYNNLQVATVSGRYYAMDRDNRWERIQLAYNAIVSGQGEKAKDYHEAVKNAYNNKLTDEFILPTVIGDYQGMQDNCAIFMINFRSDRVRQILSALLDPSFDKMERTRTIKFSKKLGMVFYSKTLDPLLETIFPPNNLSNSLGEWLSKKGLKQLRVAETEKYPHVTFFFSGGREQPFEQEDRILIPSPKVATYDLQPEMSAIEITDNLEKVLNEQTYDFIVVNYANGDMVGHTGVLQAAAKAAETVDGCLERLEKLVKKNNYNWLIIADHGNCETMWDYENNAPHTQHTTNLVRIILANQYNKTKFTGLVPGKLADVAPTILKLMDVEIPKDMDGTPLLKE